MKLRALIIDDEKPSRDNLQAILQEYFKDIDVIGQAENPDDGANLIRNMQPDLVFLDVQMGTSTGLELLNVFPEPTFETIFITAYDEYAVKAFRTKAADYLLKPIDLDDLKDAILNVMSIIKTKELANLNDQSTIDDINIPTSQHFIKVHTQDGTELISHDDILYIQSINYYTNIVLNDGREIISTKILKEYEGLLKDFNFFRIHNSYIINLKYLKGVVAKETYFAKLSNDIQISISRRRKDEFFKFLEKNKS